MWSDTRHESESVCPNNAAMNFPLGPNGKLASLIPLKRLGDQTRGWGNLSMTSNYRKNTATDLQSVVVDASHLYTAPSTVLTKDF